MKILKIFKPRAASTLYLGAYAFVVWGWDYFYTTDWMDSFMELFIDPAFYFFEPIVCGRYCQYDLLIYIIVGILSYLLVNAIDLILDRSNFRNMLTDLVLRAIPALIIFFVILVLINFVEEYYEFQEGLKGMQNLIN